MIGEALTVAAVSLDIWAIKTLLESGTTIMPHRATAHLVTRGPFRYTRNPIYLGYTLATVAFGLMTANSWFYVAAVFAAIVTTFVAIRREERHLPSSAAISKAIAEKPDAGSDAQVPTPISASRPRQASSILSSSVSVSSMSLRFLRRSSRFSSTRFIKSLSWPSSPGGSL